jgi:hypothetical protein
MPAISTTAAAFGYGRPQRQQTATGPLAGLLGTIASSLRTNIASLRNPSFYNYQCDGSGFFISDGGGDMYDSGNVTTPWLRSGTTYVSATQYSLASYPAAITYTNNTTTVTDTDFSYISLGYTQFTNPQIATFLPLTVLGTRTTTGQPCGWQIGGDSGADGGGTLASGTLYSGTTINGFTVYAFYRQTYNATDPSHCNLFILLGHPNWSSVFGTISSFADPVSNGSCGGYYYTSGAGTANILAIQSLLSKNSGVQVTAAELQTIATSYTSLIKAALGY